MKATISARGDSLQYSSIRKLMPYAQKALADGVKVIKLNIGDPDLKTPQVFIDALNHWEMNPIRYAQPQGEVQLLKALEGYYKAAGYENISDKDIVVTIGGSEALAMAMFAVADAGDEILVVEPFFANYSIIAQINGVKLIPIPTRLEEGFHLPAKVEIEKLITKKTKGILYSSPGNPTGTTYNQKEIKMLLELAFEHGIYIISDEVYREFIFTNDKHVSLCPFMDEYPENLIMLDSFSKRYNLCGARLGMVVTKSETVKSVIMRMANGRLSGGLIDQMMGSALALVDKAHFQDTALELKGRRDVVLTELKKINGVKTYTPEGAFYLMAELPVKDAEDFCRFLLEEYRYENTTVMLAPAAGFYLDPTLGKNKIRIAYVVNKKELKLAIEIIKMALKVYKG